MTVQKNEIVGLETWMGQTRVVRFREKFAKDLELLISSTLDEIISCIYFIHNYVFNAVASDSQSVPFNNYNLLLYSRLRTILFMFPQLFRFDI